MLSPGLTSACSFSGDSVHASARACLQHWAAHGLPLVVTRQPAPEGAAAHEVALGLCAPLRWQRRRLALQMPLSDLLYLDEFPTLDRIAPLLPAAERAGVRTLHQTLSRLGCTARVYGSHGWQALTGLDHLRPSSDLDLWIGLLSVAHADPQVQSFLVHPHDPPRCTRRPVLRLGWRSRSVYSGKLLA
mgnify:CR=1 FL=1